MNVRCRLFQMTETTADLHSQCLIHVPEATLVGSAKESVLAKQLLRCGSAVVHSQSSIHPDQQRDDRFHHPQLLRVSVILTS